MIWLRPRGYWSRFQAPVETIQHSLFNKLVRGRWDPDRLRFRQRHWLKVLLRQVSLYLGSNWSGNLRGAFDSLNGRSQPVGAKREPFPSLSYLPKGIVVLARPPGLYLGETPPWRTDMDENQKKRVAFFQDGGKLKSLSRSWWISRSPHLSTAGASRPSCPTTFGRVAPCMGRCSWWVINGVKGTPSP
ncbi:hypothetical protein DFAR_340062 [Desulfarculales bacterium]